MNTSTASQAHIAGRWFAGVLSMVFLAEVACGPDGSDDWSRFRGRNGDGLIADSREGAGGLPVEWSAEQGIRWKASLRGTGNSSPIVHRGQVFLTAAWEVGGGAAGKQRAVLAFDLATGAELWATELFSATPEKKHRFNTLAAPSPVVDDAVYVYFGSVLAALEFDGSVRWQHEIDPTYAQFSRYGAASSPVLTRESVIVVQDREWAQTEDVGWISAFDRKTGEPLWRSEWRNTCCSYSTPLVVDRGAGEEILFAQSGSIVSYAAADGQQLWSHSVEINQMVSSPVLDGDLLVMAGGANQIRSTEMLRLTGSGARTTVETLWQSKRFAPQDASPVLYQGKVITVTDQGIAAAHEAHTGAELWHGRLGRGRMRASLVAGDGRVYATSSGGAVVVFSAGDTFEKLAENELGETGTNASPGFADGCLLLRTSEHLWCVEARPVTAN